MKVTNDQKRSCKSKVLSIIFTVLLIGAGFGVGYMHNFHFKEFRDSLGKVSSLQPELIN